MFIAVRKVKFSKDVTNFTKVMQIKKYLAINGTHTTILFFAA